VSHAQQTLTEFSDDGSPKHHNAHAALEHVATNASSFLYNTENEIAAFLAGIGATAERLKRFRSTHFPAIDAALLKWDIAYEDLRGFQRLKEDTEETGKVI
jgi:hypothetical protein